MTKQSTRWLQIKRWRTWMTSGLALLSLAGCQSMLAQKAKPQVPQDHFSCGERMPSRPLYPVQNNGK